MRPIAAIRPGGSGDITPPEATGTNEHVAWFNDTAAGTYLPTPVLYDGGLYLLTDKGIVSRLDPKTGKVVFKSRIDRKARNFTASPWAYNGMIFCLNEEGSTFVVKAGEEFELLGVNALDEFSMATPALVGGRLLIRTPGRLYSLRQADDDGATGGGR